MYELVKVIFRLLEKFLRKHNIFQAIAIALINLVLKLFVQDFRHVIFQFYAIKFPNRKLFLFYL